MGQIEGTKESYDKGNITDEREIIQQIRGLINKGIIKKGIIKKGIIKKGII